jgi:hypothetical protein
VAPRWLTIRDDAPEVAAPGAPASGVEHRGTGLVDEDAVGAAQRLAHVPDDRLEMEAGAPDPVAERAPVKLDALPPVDAGLAVKRQVVAELRDDHLGDQALGRQPARHDVLRGMGLCDGAGTAAAGVFWPARHQNPELRRDDVEALVRRGARTVASGSRTDGALAGDRARASPSSPIFAIAPQPHGQRVLAGSITRSTRGRCAGK